MRRFTPIPSTLYNWACKAIGRCVHVKATKAHGWIGSMAPIIFFTSALPEGLSASRHGRYSPRRKDQSSVDVTVSPDVGIWRLRHRVTLHQFTSLKLHEATLGAINTSKHFNGRFCCMRLKISVPGPSCLQNMKYNIPYIINFASSFNR
jgi:hypothetical protein